MPDNQNEDRRAIETVLDSLDALVYVADMDTHELLFLNAYGREKWGEPGARKCWQVLQKGQTGPCAFCTNPLLVDEQAAGISAVIRQPAGRTGVLSESKSQPTFPTSRTCRTSSHKRSARQNNSPMRTP